MKFVPLRSTATAWPRAPPFGHIDVKDGSGFTEKAPVSAAVPPPGVGFETTTLRAPAVALEDIVI
jgi:hypothetical protein